MKEEVKNPCSNIEFRKDNTYFDKTGKQMLVGDLLKIEHFKVGKRMHYMYHVVVMEYTNEFPVMAVSDYINIKPHCRMYVLCNNEERVYENAKIINARDFQTKRKKIKRLTPCKQ